MHMPPPPPPPPPGGGGGGKEVFNYPINPEGDGADDEHQKFGDLGIAEAASPISSRPPAPPMMVQATAGVGSSSGSGNRWPRQETLALLQIRSEMDAAFRDATPKAPLWDQVSRKLAELGYKRSAKKCKEKFENVHKYYKRTKESRAGRQDGKTYKFLTQLEALDHHHPTITATTSVVQSEVPTSAAAPVSLHPPIIPQQDNPPGLAMGGAAPTSYLGVSFSSNTSSSSEDEEGEEDLEIESADARTFDRKRKRPSRSVESDEKMMEFLEGLMSKVMEKQEAMQQKFLEAIEKREKDRMIREEAWKRQDLARLGREHELMVQERAISASRDAAIIAFLEKVTGQTINLPTTPAPPPPPPQHHHQRQSTFPQPQQPQTTNYHHLQRDKPMDDELAIAPATAAEQQMIASDSMTGGATRLDAASSSRWPKPQVLALIQIRSGMDSKYQEAGPKGPLWEEISSAMKRIGYDRSAKRCKEKWENINKYYKKVKESNKKRPEDSKTCPYFHELDALYQRKLTTSGNLIIGSSSGQQEDVGIMPSAHTPPPGNEPQVAAGGEAKLPMSAMGTYSLIDEQNDRNVGEPTQKTC
ncbi:trihelix transcription factor GTL1-like isoform X2 [Andrographis paniculata]|uniref:trihelix transcription factor GTL1-like isoform X2 n=1 Tax=Andrographis paniculata TaxID=175694 RepID=UPI0021E7F7EF|nr:trihelix transcription factor GTL1-like isoform X2 [Andrographis paniculata]